MDNSAENEQFSESINLNERIWIIYLDNRTLKNCNFKGYFEEQPNFQWRV